MSENHFGRFWDLVCSDSKEENEEAQQMIENENIKSIIEMKKVVCYYIMHL
jgi:hypothetical protein